MAENDQSIEHDEMWDMEAAERRGPVSSRRTIVSVAFPSEDLAAVSHAARNTDKKLSEFIRDAAVEKALHAQGWDVGVRTHSQTSSPIINRVTTETVVYGLQAETIYAV